MQAEQVLRVGIGGTRTNENPPLVICCEVRKTRHMGINKGLTFQCKRQVQVQDGRHVRRVPIVCDQILNLTLPRAQLISRCEPLRLQGYGENS
jgi:hypothetical protein